MADKQKKIKILFVITLLDKMGGAEKNLVDIVTNLNRQQFTPFVLVFKGGELTAYLQKEERAVVSTNGITRLISFYAIKKGIEYFRFLKKENIDLVVTYHHDADIWGGCIAKLAGTPVISSRRDMGYQLELKHIIFYRLFHRIFSRFITVSDAVKNEIVKREWIAPKQIVTIHNGLQPEHFRLESDHSRLQKEFNIDENKTTIGMVASFRPIKGQIHLVEAIKIVTHTHQDIQVVVVGGFNDPEYFQFVKKRAIELGVDHYFIFTGARTDVKDFLNIFDIFIISSKNEGFSNAIIEAMAAGLPVIAPNSGGNPEAVEHKVTGFLFPSENSNILAQRLTELISNQELQGIMGQNGLKAVSERFRIDNMILKNQKLFREVVL